MAEIVPFPAYRRQRFIAKQAMQMACLSIEAADRHLQRQLKQQSDAMTLKGIAPDMVAEQRCRLERAIRAELWRIILRPGDQA